MESQNAPNDVFSYHLHQLFFFPHVVMRRELLRDELNTARDRLSASLQLTSGSHPVPAELVEKMRTVMDLFQTVQTSTQSVITPVLNILHVRFCVVNDV